MKDKPLTIGITGNIAAGKSVIRRMLANSGALGIDADLLAHRMLYPGGSAYQAVIDAFGSQILSDNHMISNQKLGEIVFNDPKRLHQLEALVHPLVIDAIHKRVNAAKSAVVAIEAIKLLESGLADDCDHVWVSHVTVGHQVQRLMTGRGMTEEQAKTRINLQPPQSLKLSQANIIINTEGSFKDTWERTQRALNDTIDSVKKDTLRHINNSSNGILKTVSSFSVSQLESSWQVLTNTNITTLYEYLGLKKVFPITVEEQILAFVIWEDWNFTGLLEQVFPLEVFQTKPGMILNAYEQYARIAQTEILLVSRTLMDDLETGLIDHGFSEHPPDALTYPAWITAGQRASQSENSHIWMKVLAQPFEKHTSI